MSVVGDHRTVFYKKVGLYLLVTVLAGVTAIPFVWMVQSSFLSNVDIMAGRWFTSFHPENYMGVWTDKYFKFFVALKNSLVIALSVTVLSVVSHLIAAYGFTYFRFRFRDEIFFIALATMMVPGTVMTIPVYVMFAKWGWTGTKLPLIFPALFPAPYWIFLFRQYMLTLDTAMFESAVVDGAGYFSILTRIVVPNMMAPIMILVIGTFSGAWSDFFGPLIYLGSDPANRTLAVALASFRNIYWSDWSGLMVGAVVLAIPVVVLYALSQRYFMQQFVISSMEK